MRFLRFAPIPLILALVVLAAGCGSGGGPKSVPSDAVAVVGSDTITKAQFTALLAGAKRNYAARKTPFPKPGTAQYKSLQDQVVQYLVQQSELKQKADELGIKITDKDVDKKLADLKKQYFGTSDTKVSDEDISDYYDSHRSTYSQPASRDVRHILVNDKSLADKLYAQLKAGADFAALAKKYSKDPGSAAQGGKLTITKGQTVAPFDKVAFSLKTGATSPPVHTTYGWHIIQALSAVKPQKQTPLKDVKDSIKQQLLQTKKTDTMTKWFNDVKKSFDKNIAYQTGYAPPATTTTATTAPTTTSQ